MAKANAYDESVINGDFKAIYHFGTEVMGGDDLNITKDGIDMKKFANQLKFNTENPYADYC